MITATTRTMQPLPVRPIDGARRAVGAAPLPHPVSGVMRPLPHPTPTSHAARDAATGAAFTRMLTRIGVNLPLPIVDVAA